MGLLRTVLSSSPTPSEWLCALFMLSKTYATPSLIFKRVMVVMVFALIILTPPPPKCRCTNLSILMLQRKYATHCCSYFVQRKNAFIWIYSFFPLQERSRSSVSLRAATEGLQTAATERSTCTFTRRTSLICARCVTSHTHIPALSGNTWR